MTTGKILLTIAATLLTGAAVAEGVHWTYAGAEGPEFWGTLSPDFAACATGTQQSPVDLTGTVPADAEDVAFAWNPAADWAVVNNGHTIQANGTGAGAITVAGKDYALLQFHFHAPSEHAIDGARAAMEVHFVHKADDGALAVVGVLMQGGGANALFDAVMAAAPAEPGEAAMGAGAAGTLMPASVHYFRYQGSLTTPPCAETVLWTVMQEPVAVSDEAIAKFEALFAGNARPLQPVNRRFILAE